MDFRSDLAGRSIALFLPNLSGGGAERVMVNLFRWFDDQGINTSLVLGNRKGDYQRAIQGRQNVIDLGTSRLIFAFIPLLAFLQRRHPSVLMSALNPANLLAIWAKILVGGTMRVVIRVGNNLSIATRAKSGLMPKILLRMMRYFFNKADAIIAISEGVADDLVATLGIPRTRISVIYNPVLESDAEELALREVDHAWFTDPNIPVIVAAGRLTLQKDYNTLFHAFAIVRKTVAARLIILGEGELRTELEQLASRLGISEQVAFLGFQNNPYAYFARSRVFALSSKWEGFGNVIVEALSVGTPVVATNCPSGPSEILGNGRFGHLVPVGDYEAFALAIINVLNKNPWPRDILINRAHEFAVDKIARKYLDVLLPKVQFHQ